MFVYLRFKGGLKFDYNKRGDPIRGYFKVKKNNEFKKIEKITGDLFKELFGKGVIHEKSLGYYPFILNSDETTIIPKEFNLPFMNFSKNPNPFFQDINIEKVEKKFNDMEFGTFGFDKLELAEIKKFTIQTVDY